MRFELDVDVLVEESTTMHDHLDRILDRVSDEVHELNLRGGDRFEQTGWFAGLRPHRKATVRAIAQASAFRPPAKVTRIGEDLPLEGAARLAFVPLAVVVENETSDGLLVRVALEAFADQKTRDLWERPPATGKALVLVHGGGTGDLKKKAQLLIDEARATGLPPRLLAMVDSDARWASEEEVSAKAREIEQLCHDAGVPCLVLSCRSAENYIPSQALDRWAQQAQNSNARPQVAALLKLSPEQRDHFPMKGKKADVKGLAAVDRDEAPRQQKELYAQVAYADRALLRGFRDDIILRLQDYLPSPTHNELDRDRRRQHAIGELDQRDSRGDLRKLVSLIEEAL